MSERAPQDRAYHAALRLLGYRFRSEAELRKRLGEKEHPAEAIEAAIERLRGEGWIDDARFAQLLAESRSRKGIGPKRVSLELRRLGVDDDTAGEAIRGRDADAAAGDLAALVRKRLRVLGRSRAAGWSPDETDRKKLLAYLLRQGYEYAAAADALAQALREGDE